MRAASFSETRLPDWTVSMANIPPINATCGCHKNISKINAYLYASHGNTNPLSNISSKQLTPIVILQGTTQKDHNMHLHSQRNLKSYIKLVMLTRLAIHPDNKCQEPLAHWQKSHHIRSESSATNLQSHVTKWHNLYYFHFKKQSYWAT